MKNCECCDLARDNPHYLVYSEGCTHCCARLLINLERYRLTPEALRKRRQDNVAAWVRRGASEIEIRRMFKAGATFGQECSLESERPTRKRRR